MVLENLQLSLGSCPVCSQKDFKLLNNNDRYFMKLHTVGCNVCGLVQVNPRPSEEGVRYFYANEYRKFYQGVSTPDEDYIHQNHKYERMKYLVSYIKNFAEFCESVNILDIGCSEGAFFSVLRQEGFLGSLYGVELNSSFANYASINNGAYVLPSIEEFHTPCDLITLNHVFEHLLKPADFLREIKRLLKQDGIIFIDVPDVEEYQSIADLHIAHLFHYSIKTLTSLLEISGYKIINCEKHQPPYHPKSIRLIAKKCEDASNKTVIKSKSETELESWRKISGFSSLNYKVKLFIAAIPYVGYLLKLIRSKK